MDSARGAIREAMLAAPRGERTATADRLAALYRVSRSAVYAAARVGGAKRPRVSRPDYEAWTETASAIALLAPKPMPLDVAIRAGVESGELPPEAAAMPLGTAQRIRRRRGWRAAPKRHGRLSAERPLQAAQVDGSGSEHLVVEEERDGDWVLRLHRRPWSASGYKNKPLGPGRLSLKIYALWDMCTGAVRSRYCVARGETALDALEFLVWAFGAPGSVVRGVPENLWSDLGPLARHAASRDLLERLDVHVDLPGEGYAKERMGGPRARRAGATVEPGALRPHFLVVAAPTLGQSALQIDIVHARSSMRRASCPSITPWLNSCRVTARSSSCSRCAVRHHSALDSSNSSRSTRSSPSRGEPVAAVASATARGIRSCGGGSSPRTSCSCTAAAAHSRRIGSAFTRPRTPAGAAAPRRSPPGAAPAPAARPATRRSRSPAAARRG